MVFPVVVICFQILTFAVAATVIKIMRKNLFSCDLLSNSYLCSSCDSSTLYNVVRYSVVICFQILTFAVAATVRWHVCEQLACCDLLSNSYLCSSCDSPTFVQRITLTVVICFQILTFAVAATVRTRAYLFAQEL